MKREAANFPFAAQEAVRLEATDAEYLTVNRIAMTSSESSDVDDQEDYGF